MFTGWVARLRILLAGRRPGELEDELRFHMEQSTRANLSAGLTPVEARRQSMMAFDGLGGHAR